jgi:hypothetical protein
MYESQLIYRLWYMYIYILICIYIYMCFICANVFLHEYLHSASDRSSPLVCSPSEEEKGGPPAPPASHTPRSGDYEFEYLAKELMRFNTQNHESSVLYLHLFGDFEC